MSFDRLAPHYRWMEALLAGMKLQRCRTAFLTQIQPPREVLVLGEGTGTFVAALMAAYPQARITCVDSSAGMIEQARTRLGASRNVSFVHADVLAWTPPAARFDLIVSHFFLDCFSRDELKLLANRVSIAATDDAQWLLSDFREPAAGVARWRAKGIIKLLYAFFRRATRLSASHITPPDQILPAHGFRLRNRLLFDWGLLHADWWSRDPSRQQSAAHI